MKTLYKILSLTFLLLFAFTACSKDNTVDDVYQGATVEKTIELVTDFSDEARAIYAVSRDENFRINANLQMPEKDLQVRLAIRRGTSAPLYHTVTFKKVKGQNKAFFKGKLEVPDVATGNYQISAVVLSEVGTPSHTYATLGDSENIVKAVANKGLATKNARNNMVSTQIPYVLKWTNLRLMPAPVGGKQYLQANLSFKPSGSLLAFRVDNYAGKTDIVVTKIKIKSNAFVLNWEYDLANLTGGNLQEGKATTTAIDVTYTLPQPLTVRAGQVSDTYYYLTVMPVKATTNLATDVTVIASTGKEFKIKTNNKVLAFGSVPATLSLSYEKEPAPIAESCFPSKKLPLEFVAHYNIAPNGTSFDKTLANNTGGHYTHAEAVAKFGKGINIEGSTYYLPSQPQMRAILPRETIYLISGNEQKNIEEEIVADNETYRTTADYRAETTSPGVLPRKLYALRLKHSNLCMQTAYRYEFIGNFTENSTNSYLKITCRYLGNNAEWTLDDIANEAFWAKDPSKDVVRYFPAATGNTERARYGGSGAYWTSSDSPQGQIGYKGDAGFQYYPAQYVGRPQYKPEHFELFGEHSTETYKFPVRLFSRTVVTPASISAPAR